MAENAFRTAPSSLRAAAVLAVATVDGFRRMVLSAFLIRVR